MVRNLIIEILLVPMYICKLSKGVEEEILTEFREDFLVILRNYEIESIRVAEK